MRIVCLMAFCVMVLLACSPGSQSLSGEMQKSRCLGVEIPIETTAMVASVHGAALPAGSNKSLDAKNHIQKIKLTGINLNFSGNPFIIIVSAYESVEWDFSRVDQSLVKGVIVYGFNEQRVAGVVDGIPVRNLSHEKADSAESADCSKYRYFYRRGTDFDAFVDELMEKDEIIVSNFNGGYRTDDIILAGPDNQNVVADIDEKFATENFEDDFPGSERLRVLVDEGVIRPAIANDIKSWNRNVELNARAGSLTPSISEHTAANEFYVVLGAFVVPDGMYGSESRNFIIPVGMKMPSDSGSHNSYYFMESGVCKGPLEPCYR